MITRRTLTLAILAVVVGSPAHAGLFTDVTEASIGRSTDDPATDGWSNKVELADIDGDGDVDILVANGGDYETPGTPEMSFAYLNDGNGHFTDASADVFGAPGLTRVIRAADVDGDGSLDLFVGGAWQTPSRLLMNDGAGHFTDASDRLPYSSATCSFGDAKLGDIDGDGDLDIVAADWGDGDPFQVRGRPIAWLNDGHGAFVDGTDMFPTTKTGMSWDLELLDADDDLDLDVVISCKSCVDGGVYLENEGDGTFLDRSGVLPGEGNNYEFEPFDVDNDGDLDLFTVNDGPDLRERLLTNDLAGSGVFVDGDDRISGEANPSEDDNAALFFDADGDGDVDVLVGSLSGADRVLVNDGAGHFTSSVEATPGADTPGTLGIAVADLDGDHKLDLVMVQGEQAFGDRIYQGVDVPEDATAPFIGPLRLQGDVIFARVHDWKTPVAAFDFQSVDLVVDGTPHPMVHVGEQLFRASVPDGSSAALVRAVDAAGNASESEPLQLTREPVGPGGGGGGCGSCSATSLAPSFVSLVALWFVRRRRGAP